MKTIESIDKKICSGCSSCYNVCPVNAIEMIENSEGFLYPAINKDKCTNCGLCQKSCPIINPQYNNSSKPSCYAAMASDEIRYNSSSGGVFPVLAYNILKRGGFVAGAIWSGTGVRHIVSNNKEDVEKMRGSKYLQSSIRTCFKEIKNLLNQDKEVLFTGTPCQIAGLKAYLQKDYKTLYTIDLACHGTPSPKVFRKYLEEEMAPSGEFIETNFRDKINGWSSQLISTTKTTTSTTSKLAQDDNYMRAFLKNLCLRESCGNCLFNKIPRQADITIGDFWGIDKYNPALNDKKGTSVILVNNKKGDKLIKEIIANLKLFKKAPLKYAIKGNPIFIRSSNHHKNRANFFNDIDKLKIKEAVKNNLNEKYEGVILNFWFSSVNYGAVLTAYCIQQYFLELGKDYRILNWMKPAWKKRFPGSFCERFTKKHIKLTKEFNDIAELKNLNSYTDNFIVGSDQVFRYKYTQNDLDVYLLKFTDFSKKRIAFSASFGKDVYEAEQLTTYEAQKALKRFDAISTREESGVDICKDTFDIKAQHILDPVFLVKKETIEKLINKDSKKYKGKVVTYVLDERKTVQANISKLAKELNKEQISIVDKDIDMEEWLEAIYNCDYFITDSFHGACCAIIFNKPFICLKNILRGASRFESLQNTFNIHKNFVYDANSISKSEIINSYIDWTKVENIIETERIKAKQWINNALTSSKAESSIVSELDFLNNHKNITNPQKPKKKEKFIEKIFSAKNATSRKKKYKVITILGIKIKFKISKIK